MSTTRPFVELERAPIEIIDGDRGTHYPGQNELQDDGYCLFLSATNVTTSGFKFDSCQFIEEQKDRVLRKGKLKRKDIVMTTRGTLGNIAYYSDDVPFEDVRINSGMVIFRAVEDSLRPEYLYYALRSAGTAQQINSLRSGAAQPQLPIRDIKKIRIPLPEPGLQDCVVDAAKPYDDLIANNQRRIELLEQSARLLFKEWFVHLRYPGHEHGRIVGGVPDGWRIEPLSSIIDVNPHEALSKGTELWYVPMSSLSEGGMTLDVNDFERRTTHTAVRFRNGDTLFARITPCLENGKTGYVHFLNDGEVACGSTEFIVLRGKSVGSEFTYCLAREDYVRGRAIKSMIGSSGRQRVRDSCFDDLRVNVPPASLMAGFEEVASACFREIKNLGRQNEKLNRARDLLLPRLMDGRLSV